jgi:hypothetical protein
MATEEHLAGGKFLTVGTEHTCIKKYRAGPRRSVVSRRQGKLEQGTAVLTILKHKYNEPWART